MKISPVWTGFLVSLAACIAPHGAIASGVITKPNIVLCILDDMDHSLFSFRGHSDATTPTFDRLARHGTVINTCYMQSRCAPSLASILTGKLAHEHGHYFNFDSTGKNRGIDPASTFVRKLKDEGNYQTYVGGKWWPGYGQISDAGFDTGEIGGLNNGKFVRSDQQSSLFEWMDQLDQERPFFIWWAPLLPHTPHDPPQRFLDRYESAAIDVPACITPQHLDGYLGNQRYFLAMVAWVDDEVRRLLEKIKAIGRDDNTMVITVIDNGFSFDCEPSKGFYNRAGWETPVILTYPSKIPARETRSHLARASDLFPTILDYAEIPHQPVSGESLRTIIENPHAPWRPFIVDLNYPARSITSSAFEEAFGVLVRSQVWSYGRALRQISQSANNRNRIQHQYTTYPNRLAGEVDLHRLLVDPNQRQNLSASPWPHHQMVKMLMRETADDWLKQIGYSSSE